MTLAERIKERRKRADLSQAALAEKLFVSRQAVTKWESGRGTPDVENIQAMAQLFGVSVDYLLQDESVALPGKVVIQENIDVSALPPTKGQFGFRSRANTAVLQCFPSFHLTALMRSRKNSRVQESIEWASAILFDSPFNLFATADSIANRDEYYLAQKDERQLLVQVSKNKVEARELAEKVESGKFFVGSDRFVKHPRSK